MTDNQYAWSEDDSIHAVVLFPGIQGRQLMRTWRSDGTKSEPAKATVAASYLRRDDQRTRNRERRQSTGVLAMRGCSLLFAGEAEYWPGGKRHSYGERCVVD